MDYLASLHFQIIFISNSPIGQVDRLNLKKNLLICRIEERENKGNDFGAWKWAIDNKLIPLDTDHLVLTNDSIFGPISDMNPILESMAAKPHLDFWGLTDSWQGGWHIQSYFLCLSKKVFTSNSFRNLFSRDFSSFTKKEIIEKGEILLTKELSSAGFRGEAYVPYEKLDPEQGSVFAHNPSHYFYEKLIRYYKFPFLKKELVLKNPENLSGIPEMFDYIDRNSAYSINNIEEALIEAYQPATINVYEKPAISVLCHMYYPSCIYYFLSKLALLKSYPCVFIFNLSTALFENKYFFHILTRSFPGAVILHSPAKGRDIGGKLLAIDTFLRLNPVSDYSLIIHDKLSPHTPTGKDWRDKLFKIIDQSSLPGIFKNFERNRDLGVIAANEFIQNEYDPDKDSFTCTSKDNLTNYIKMFNLNLSDYNFAAGTIFWIRTSIFRLFFGQYPPLLIREGLETGNALHFNRGTNIHAWERLFSLLANAHGYKVGGI